LALNIKYSIRDSIATLIRLYTVRCPQHYVMGLSVTDLSASTPFVHQLTQHSMKATPIDHPLGRNSCRHFFIPHFLLFSGFWL